MSAPRRLRDLGSLLDQDRAALERLARAWTEHPHPVLFAGAGLPAFNTRPKPGLTARALGWVGLADLWRKEFEREGVKTLPPDPLRLAQLFEQAFGRSRLLDTLELAVPEEDLEIEPAYRQIASIPWGAIVTTNYDSFLERAFQGTQLRLLRIARDPDITRRRSMTEIPLIKMHGEFAHRDLIVITEDDYNDYRRTRPGVATKVDQLLIEHPILFVGFSLDDPNVARILNWVRATTGTLQLPSVSIVHSAPSRPECELWASRGVRLVHCPKDLQLAELLAAFDREREAPPPAMAPKDERAIELAQQLRAVVQAQTSGWEVRAKEAILRLLDHADAGHRSAASRSAAGVQADDWRPVLACLSHEDLTRWMRLLAEASPFFDCRRLDGPTGHAPVLILVGLLAYGALTNEERTDLALKWVRKWADSAPSPQLRSLLTSLRELRDGDLTAASRSSLDIEIRELIFLLGDDEELRRELAGPWAAEDPLALCRRGADFLLLGDTRSARSCYARARDRSRTGDESYASLFGLWECEAWSEEARQERDRIPEVQRPGSEEIWKLRQLAGEQGLERPTNALGHLEEFLRAARAHGWPHSSRLNGTGPLENVGKVIARLELETGRPEQVRIAIVWLLRLGIFEKDSLSDDGLEVLAGLPEDWSEVRGWLDRRFASPRRRESQMLCSIRCFDLLDDREIDAAVRTSIEDPLGSGDEAHLDGAALERWKFLARQSQRLPTDTALRIAGVLPRVLRIPGFRAAECLDAIHPGLWPAPAEILRDRPEIRSLVEALIARCRSPNLLPNWPEREAIFGAIGRLAQAKLLTDGDRDAFRLAVNESVATQAADRDDALPRVLSVVDVLLELGVAKGSLADRFADALVAGHANVANSTLLGRWCWGARELGPSTSGQRFDDLFREVMQSATLAIARPRRETSLFPFPNWAWEIALALRALAGVADERRKAEAVEAITRLGERWPEALPALFGLGSVDPALLTTAEERIARALYAARDDGERQRATQAVAAWCELQCEAKAQPSERIWELFIATVAVNPALSDRERGSFGWFADRGLIPEVYRERIAELILAGTADDQSWSVRVRSASVLRAVTKGTRHQERARERLRELLGAPVALLRRVAECALSQMAD